MKNFKSKLILITLTLVLTTKSYGGDGTSVVVRHPDGRVETLGAFLEFSSIPVKNGCTLLNTAKEISPVLREINYQWEKGINQIYSNLYRKLPGAGELFRFAFQETNFYFVTLPKGANLGYSNDDGGVITFLKASAAVRKGSEVYIDIDKWNQIFKTAKTNSEERSSQTSFSIQAVLNFYLMTIEQTMLPYYYYRNDTYRIQKFAVELLRLSHLFPSVLPFKDSQNKRSLIAVGSKEARGRILDMGIRPLSRKIEMNEETGVFTTQLIPVVNGLAKDFSMTYTAHNRGRELSPKLDEFDEDEVLGNYLSVLRQHAKDNFYPKNRTEDWKLEGKALAANFTIVGLADAPRIFPWQYFYKSRRFPTVYKYDSSHYSRVYYKTYHTTDTFHRLAGYKSGNFDKLCSPEPK